MTPRAVLDLVDTAVGRAHRHDPVRPRGGGPAGNARLTAWAGLVLLVLFAVEGATLLALSALLGVHIVVGGVLVPVVLLKTGSTGWRIVRYYGGERHYRAAGPPPLVLRVAGPLVVLTGLAVLATGIALIPAGPAGGRADLVAVGPVGLSWLTLHKLTFIAWFVVMVVHVLARTWPAWQLAAADGADAVAGRRARLSLLAASLLVGAVVGALLLAYSGAWLSGGRFG